MPRVKMPVSAVGGSSPQNLTDAQLTANNILHAYIQPNQNVNGITMDVRRVDINGFVRARDIKVNTFTSWPDDVFDPRTELPTLDSIRTYVTTNRHLPDMPSAETVMQDGLSFAESQRALVAHVERLTLYILAQEERMRNLELQLQQRYPSTKPICQD